MNYSKKNMKKKQNFGNASRKIYKKNHRRLRKSAKNKQSTNLLFKTVKLYQKQKHKYLDKPKHQRQNGGNNPIFKGGNKPIKLSADDIIDKERRKTASQDQVIKKLLRDLKRHNVSNLVRNKKVARILVSHKIYSFDDLSKHSSDAIDKLIKTMDISSLEADKFKKLISTHKNKETSDKQDSDETTQKKQKTAKSKKSVKDLLLEIKDLKNKLSNVQLAMQNMKSHTGTPVCFDTTTADVKGKDGKTKKGTTVRVCVNTKKSVEQWVKSISKGHGKDRVITGNDISVKAEAK